MTAFDVPAEVAAEACRVVLVGHGLEPLGAALAGHGLGVEHATGPREATARLAALAGPAVVASFLGEDAELLELVESIHRFTPEARLVVAGEASLPRPGSGTARLPRGSSLEAVLRAVLDAARALPSATPGEAMVAADAKMMRLMAQAGRAAQSDATVLIEGESGTGKEVLARAVHRMSPRREGPFVAVNCAALPDGLIESELFGHERGAFTGAVGSRAGRFELASGGTLLLDEIGEMPLAVQSKLLRVLQERAVERVGGAKLVAFNVRVIATTNRNLEDEVRRGHFRLDLYYRLAVLKLWVPALRERPDDVAALARSFLPADKELSHEALEALRRHPWPGNVRELHNVIERAVVLSDGPRVTVQDLGLERGSAGAQGVPRGTLEEVERMCIRAALEECHGNRTHAAKLLGISIRTLRNRLAEYRAAGLVMPGEREGQASCPSR